MNKSIKYQGLTVVIIGLFLALPATASLHASGVYGGTSFGVSQLSGNRTDSISDGVTTLTIFPHQRMSDTSLEANLFAGYRYVPCHTNFVFSLEGFLTYGPYEQAVYRDLTPGSNGNQTGIFTRGIGYGMTVRAGYIAHQQLMPYLLMGTRMDRFTYNSIASDATSLMTKKFLVGTDFGGGVETCLGGLKTALEFKYTYYHRETRFIVESATGNFAMISARPRSASLSLRFLYSF